ncbi:MAG: hypothetical protein VKO64_08620 [Candidatus Sericytochromatia bacterium]|nr:hypothetical protein [Candidatus Sericytochromatia bacterium]
MKFSGVFWGMVAAASVVACAGPVVSRSGLSPEPSVATSPPTPLELEPPPTGQGVQLVIEPFEVRRGQEIQRNFYLKLPVDRQVAVTRIDFAMREGSHHCNLFKTDEATPDHFEDTFDQVPFTRYDLFAGNQTPQSTWQLPAGTGIYLSPRQQLVIQSHYVNASTQTTPERAEVKVNLWFAPEGAKPERMGTLFANNRRLIIPPQATASFTQWFVFRRDVHVAAMTGHFHSRGKRFAVSRWDGARLGELLYESLAWTEPPFTTYSDPGIPVASGSGVSFTADYVNRSDATVTFGGKVETQEHANLFLYFWPANPGRDALYTVTDGDEEQGLLSEQE